MNKSLTFQFTRARTLSEADQSRLAEFVRDFIESAGGADQFEDDMQDPAYRAYVEQALTEGETDIREGKCAPIRDVFDLMIRHFKIKHGL